MVATELAAGRELDARIVVEVFEWERRSESWYDEEGIEGTRFIAPDGTEVTALGWDDECDYDGLDDALPHYSTDIAAAFTIVDHILNDPLRAWEGFELVSMPRRPNEDQVAEWRAIFADRWGEARAFAPTRPLAICRAALLTLPAVAEPV